MALQCRGALLALPVLLLSLLPAIAVRDSPAGGGPGPVSGSNNGSSGGGSGGGNGAEDGSRLFFQPDGTFRIMQITDLQ
jgi:hypothetical protein